MIMAKFAEFILTTFKGRLVLFAILASLIFLFSDKAEAKTFVIGDSIAVGIADANGLDRAGNNRWRRGGKDTAAIVRYVDYFISTGQANGAVVILSSGASNSTYERPNGEGRNLDTRLIRQQIGNLRAAGALVFLVGTGSHQSPWIHNRYGTYRVNFARQNVNARLAQIANEEGIVFLGPLENYGRLGDGIHPGGRSAQLIYQRVLQELNP
jgi:hypothetical protein